MVCSLSLILVPGLAGPARLADRTLVEDVRTMAGVGGLDHT